MAFLLVFLTSAVVAFYSTRALRRYASSRGIVDIPNRRSLHKEPVPRGGGLAIVVTFCCGMALLSAWGAAPMRWTIAVAGGLAVALIGWLDDRRGVTVRTRVGVHFVAAAWAVWWLGGLEALRLDGATLHMPMFGSVLGLIGIVWWTNLYNFMDGIDGLAGGQAVSVAAAAAALMAWKGFPTGAMSALLLAGAAAGFLALNWAPARIFMGDVGSGFLGFTFGTLAIATEKMHALPLVVWLLLSAVFLFDSTLTLVRRVIHGERWYEAHRSHAYQRLVVAGWSHGAVSSAILLINAALAAGAWYALRGGSLIVVVGAAALLLTSAYMAVERLVPMPASRTLESPMADGGRGAAPPNRKD